MSVNEKINDLQDQLNELKNKVSGTEIVIVLDRSGSMQSNKSDHEGGLNAFVEKQKSVPGQCYLTFVRFDSENPFELVYDGMNIGSVPQLKLEPRGSTPLRDAIGKTILHMENRLMSRPHRDVLFLIVSDGAENASTEWTRTALRSKVEEKKKDDWQFVFLGTNFDVVMAGVETGFDAHKNVTYTNNYASIHAAYTQSANKMHAFRSARGSGQSVQVSADNLNFSETEIEEIREAQ